MIMIPQLLMLVLFPVLTVVIDTVKMKELIDKFDVGLDDSIKKTTVMTVKDLDSVLALK